MKPTEYTRRSCRDVRYCCIYCHKEFGTYEGCSVHIGIKHKKKGHSKK